MKFIVNRTKKKCLSFAYTHEILFDKNSNSQITQQNTFDTIVHQLIHHNLTATLASYFWIVIYSVFCHIKYNEKDSIPGENIPPKDEV